MGIEPGTIRIVLWHILCYISMPFSQIRGGYRISQRVPGPKGGGDQPIIRPTFPENCTNTEKIGSGTSKILLCLSDTA